MNLEIRKRHCLSGFKFYLRQKQLYLSFKLENINKIIFWHVCQMNLNLKQKRNTFSAICLPIFNIILKNTFSAFL